MMVAKTDLTHCPRCGAELKIAAAIAYVEDGYAFIEWHECPACGWQDRD